MQNWNVNELRELVDTLPQIIWILAPGGQIEYYNERWHQYTGLTLDETLKKGWESVIHPEDLERCVNQWQESLRTGKPLEVEYRFRRQDGTYRWYLGSTIPLRAEEGTIKRWVGAATEIEHQKQALENIQLERDLRNRFIATLTHDLRTPLTAARLATELILSRTDQPVLVQNLSFKILEDLDRVTKMIRDLLDTNRVKVGEELPISTAHCDIVQIVTLTLDQLTRIYGDRFSLRSEHESIQGFWDPEGVRRILENLCDNAIKYGNPQRPITVTLHQSEGNGIIEVHNEGSVLSPEDQERLFLPFQRAHSVQKSEKKGWGLGLTLVKGIAEAHGGSVFVRSNAERGTTFVVTLPNGAFPSPSNMS